MEFNCIAKGIELIGSSIKKINIENSIVELDKNAKRSLGLGINEPVISKNGDLFYSEMIIDFHIEVEQDDNQKCLIEFSLESAFSSEKDVDEETFKQLVSINGAAAMIGIARGKVENISSSIFHEGKLSIPFINVIEYYKNISKNATQGEIKPHRGRKKKVVTEKE